MSSGIAFPRSLSFEGLTWHLIYNPTDPAAGVPPDVSNAKFDARCDPVRVAGQNQSLFMLIVDFVLPTRTTVDGQLIPERRMRAFKLSRVAVDSVNSIIPAELVFYLAEPLPGSQGSGAQRFLDTILGVAAEETAKRAAPDTSWCNILSNTAPTVSADKTTVVPERVDE